MSFRTTFSKTLLAVLLFLLVASASLLMRPVLADETADKIPFRLEIGKHYEIMPGDTAFINVVKTGGSEEIHGYDLLIGYDLDVLTPVAISAGVTHQIPGPYEWEYFSQRSGPSGCTESGCPSGLLRAVCLSDINNGEHHPAQQVIPDGTILFTIKFLITDDTTRVSEKFPVRFFWRDCGDNAIVFPEDGYERLALSDTVIDLQGIDITDTTRAFPTYYGTLPACIITGVPNPNKRFVNLVNGGASIYSPEIPVQGDLNLNGIAYEIADAVLFANYLFMGASVFTINPTAQINASDVKKDNIPLTIEDFIYLVKVLNGYLPPWVQGPPPMVTERFDGLLGISETDSSLIIRADFDDSASAMHLCFHVPGYDTGWYEFRGLGDIEDTMLYGYVQNDSMKILVGTSLVTTNTALIRPGERDLFEFVFHGVKPTFAYATAAGFWAQHVNLHVAAIPNEPPIFDAYPAELVNDQFGGFHYTFMAHDANTPADSISFQIVSGPGTIDPLTGEYSYLPLCLDTGEAAILEICVSDFAHPCPQSDPGLHAYVRLAVDSLPPLPGDVNHSGAVNIGDITYTINFVYKDGEPPLPVPAIGDPNGDGIINIRDITYLINYLYKQGTPPICTGGDVPSGGLIGHSDCKSGQTGKLLADSLQEDCVTYSYDSLGNLRLTHINALFNCCPNLVASVEVTDGFITITEFDSLYNGGCDCNCPFDMTYLITNLPAEIYTIRIIEPYVPQSEPVLEFTTDLIAWPQGYYCVDRPWLPWIGAKAPK